ncbi:hypothetical protein HPB48_014470 [Haemaphysalis longicornis]|uniref:Uncharacterized protein n=1 Tax=Haemaphysalis longicornis TaxID=44386 RepID=A0A9J6FU09_HAELO|nr:hypothetical protein HPB48_014470 [Haemaphysalis longicornis]
MAPPTFINNNPNWEAALHSNNPENQLRLVHLGLKRTGTGGLPSRGRRVWGLGRLGRSHMGR